VSVHNEERRKDLKDIKDLMETAHGRRVIWRILEVGRVFSSTFSIEPLNMAFLEGHRNIGLAFLADVMDVAPKKFQVMMLEAKERKDLVLTLLAKEEETNNEEI
jgi:hypothetical protein